MRALRQWGRAAAPTAPASSLAVFAAALALVAAPVGSATAAGGRDPSVRPTRTLAVLLGPHAAMSAPDRRSALLQVVAALRPLTGERTVLPVIGHRSDAGGTVWLRVLLPGRPNGHTGWIRRRSTARATTSWQIVVETSKRRVIVYSHGRPVRAFEAIVGKPATPTPRGEFFVEEAIRLRAGDVGAPFALALSARSNVLQKFDGGPGQIALHGLMNIGGALGSAASHGCVRLANDAMRWLVGRIGPGVPVTITR